MNSLVKLETRTETHFFSIPHIQGLKIDRTATEPSIKIYLSGKTTEIQVIDLEEMTIVHDSLKLKYDRDFRKYRKLKEQNLKHIQTVCMALLEPYLGRESFNAAKSRFAYRQTKQVVVNKFSEFAYNCMVYLWRNEERNRTKMINSLSMPAVSEFDKTVDHLFVNIMKDVEGFEVYNLYCTDFIKKLLGKCNELCEPCLRPRHNTYKPDPDQAYQVALQFIDSLNSQIQSYYTGQQGMSITGPVDLPTHGFDFIEETQ